MSSNGFIDDGFGNRWARCDLADCDLAVVRPGKAQCSNCDVLELRAEREMLREPLRALLAAVQTARERGQVAIEISLSSELVERLESLAELGPLPAEATGADGGVCALKVTNGSESARIGSETQPAPAAEEHDRPC